MTGGLPCARGLLAGSNAALQAQLRGVAPGPTAPVTGRAEVFATERVAI